MRIIFLFLFSCSLAFGQVFTLNDPVQPWNPPVASGGGASTEWVTSFNTAGGTRADFDGVVGMKFTPGSTISVTKLSVYVRSGDTQTRRCGLFNASGVLLGQVSITTSGAPAGYKSVALGSPITCTGGTQYILGMEIFNAGDAWYDAQTPTVTGAATDDQAVYTTNANIYFATAGNVQLLDENNPVRESVLSVGTLFIGP